MKKLIYTFLLLFAFTVAHAQTDDDKAKAYYQEAVKAFDNRNYQQTLDYCDQIIDLLKKTNARVEILKIKSYYALGATENAKQALRKFSDLPAEPNLIDEALSYVAKIQNDEKKEKEKIKKEKRLAEEQRIELEKRTEEANRKKELAKTTLFNKAMTGEISSIRQFLKEYPTDYRKPQVMNILENQEEIAFFEAVEQNKISVYERYLTQFYDGKYIQVIKESLFLAQEVEAFKNINTNPSIDLFDKYLSTYPNGENRMEILRIYEEYLSNSGEEAITAKNYEKAELFYGTYIKNFPEGTNIIYAKKKYELAKRKLEKQVIIANRTDKEYFMINYGTNNSIGLGLGRLNTSHRLSTYATLNVDSKFNVFNMTFTPDDIEKLEDYEGTNALEPGFLTFSFGLNCTVAYPLALYLGGGIRYKEYVDNDNNDYSYKLKDEKPLKFFPEAGLKAVLGKFLVLKLGVQFIGDETSLQLGLGF